MISVILYRQVCGIRVFIIRQDFGFNLFSLILHGFDRLGFFSHSGSFFRLEHLHGLSRQGFFSVTDYAAIFLTERAGRGSKRKFRRERAAESVAVASDVAPFSAFVGTLPLIGQTAAARFHSEADRVAFFPDHIFRLLHNFNCARLHGIGRIRRITYQFFGDLRLILSRFLNSHWFGFFFVNNGSLFNNHSRDRESRHSFCTVADHAAVLPVGCVGFDGKRKFRCLRAKESVAVDADICPIDAIGALLPLIGEAVSNHHSVQPDRVALRSGRILRLHYDFNGCSC